MYSRDAPVRRLIFSLHDVSLAKHAWKKSLTLHFLEPLTARRLRQNQCREQKWKKTETGKVLTKIYKLKRPRGIGDIRARKFTQQPGSEICGQRLSPSKQAVQMDQLYAAGL